MGFGIKKYFDSKRYDEREKLKKREMHDKAELENIKSERSSIKTRATLRKEKRSLQRDRVSNSTIGRAFAGVKSLSKGKSQRAKGGKSVMQRTTINPAFSLGKEEKKEKKKTITIKIQQ